MPLITKKPLPLITNKPMPLLIKKQKRTPIMKPEDKKEIEAIERELHPDGQQVRTAIDPSKNYK